MKTSKHLEIKLTLLTAALLGLLTSIVAPMLLLGMLVFSDGVTKSGSFSAAVVLAIIISLCMLVYAVISNVIVMYISKGSGKKHNIFIGILVTWFISSIVYWLFPVGVLLFF